LSTSCTISAPVSASVVAALDHILEKEREIQRVQSTLANMSKVLPLPGSKEAPNTFNKTFGDTDVAEFWDMCIEVARVCQPDLLETTKIDDFKEALLGWRIIGPSGCIRTLMSGKMPQHLMN
jgi:hypothetical protein